MKRFISLILSIVMLSSITAGLDFSAYALSTSGSCGESATYTIDGTVLTVSGTGEMTAYAKAADRPWSDFCNTITSVVVEEGITAIGDNCFQSFSALTDVSLPSTLKYIDTRAFTACSILESIVLPEGLEYIGDQAFIRNYKLRNVNCPSTLKTIDEKAFAFCYDLQKMDFNEGLKAIGSQAFCKSGITSFTAPSTLDEISDSIFISCVDLKTADMSKSPAVLVGDGIFDGCTSLEKVILPPALEYLPAEMFYTCESLEEITIPAFVNEISKDNAQFEGCINLRNIYVKDNNPDFTDVDGVVFSKDLKTLVLYPSGRQGAYTIPDTVETISSLAFSCCTGLTEITIPASVKTIESDAFSYCEELTKVTFDNDFSAPLGEYMFENCSKLSEVELGGTTEIAYSCFSYCNSLEFITIPASCTQISTNAFYYSGLRYVMIEDGVERIGSSAFGNTQLVTISIPSSVTRIASGAFSNIKNKFTIITEADSYAYNYAVNNNYNVNTNAGKAVVTFDANGGICGITDKEVMYGEKYGTLPVPLKADSTFMGWYTQKSGGTCVTAETVNGNINDHTLYAHWQGDPVKIIFDAGKGRCDVESSFVYYDQPYSDALGKDFPAVTAPEGYTFKGWCYEDETDASIDDVAESTSTIVLVAEYAPITYKVKYYNGTKNVSETSSLTYDQEYKITNSVYSRTGYKFAGWSLSADESTLDFKPGETFKNLASEQGANVYLYAVFVSYDILELDVSSTAVISKANEVIYYSFMPSVTGSYEFSSAGDKNTRGAILDANMKELISDEISGDGVNFRITYRLEKGIKYNFAVKILNGATGTTAVTLSKVNSVNVKFDANGGKCDTSSKLVTVGKTYGELPAATSTSGYYFDGWYTAKSGGTRVDLNSIVNSDSDHTLYAHWFGETYTVSYCIGTRRINTSTHVFGVASPLKTAEELGITNYKKGHHFAGWSKAVNSDTVMWNDGQMVSDISSTGGVVSIYAVFIRDESTIHYVSDGTVIASEAYNYAQGGELRKFDTMNISKEGYHFAGWSRSPYASSVDYKDGAENVELVTDSNGNGYLYAVWEPNTYYIDYYDGDTFLCRSTVVYNTLTKTYLKSQIESIYGISIGDENYSIEGDNETLIGWTTEKGTKNVEYGVGTRVLNLTSENGGVINFYAVIVKNGNVDFRFNTSDGKTVYATDSFAVENVSSDAFLTSYETVISPEDREGIFLGWATEPNSNEVVYTDEQQIKPYEYDANTTVNLYAVWKVVRHTITFVVEDPELYCDTVSMVVTEGGVYDLPRAESTTYGKEFGGWIINGKLVSNGDIVEITEDAVAVASVFSRQVDMEFDANGAAISLIAYNRRVVYGRPYGELPEITRSGYTFLGWTLTQGGDDYITADMKVTQTDDFTVYASWKRYKTKITLNANGGQCNVKEINLSYGDIIKTLPTPTRDGYYFDGWYLDGYDDDAILYNGMRFNYAIDGTASATARWLKLKDVRFIYNDGTDGEETISQIIGARYDLAGEPVRDGYEFLGWFTHSKGGVEFTSSDYVQEEDPSTLYAHWAKIIVECQHNNTFTENVVTATCTQPGYTGDVVCANCGKLLKQGNTISPTGHQYDRYYQAPTCTELGYIEYTCRICKYTYYAEFLDFVPHNYEMVSVVPPTCTAAGYTDYRCTVCNAEKTDNYIASPGHNYVTVVTPPTEEDEGYTTYTCTVCGESHKGDFTKPTGHVHSVVFDEAVPATCISTGLTDGSHCRTCGEIIVKQQSTPMLNHSYVRIVTAPTCTKKGYTTYICQRCNNSYTDSYTNTVNHVLTPAQTIAPTCTAKGYTVYNCKNCNYTVKDNYVNALGHKTVSKTTKATMSANGSITSTCTVCKNVISTKTIAKIKSVESSAHTYTYNKKSHAPTITIKDANGKKLVRNVDYKLTYPKKRVNVGIYYVAVSFIGNYSGKTTVSFKIRPKKTSLISIESGKKQFTVKYKKQADQTTGYQIQYATDKNFKSVRKHAYVKDTSVTKKTVRKLKANKKYYVRIRTYTDINVNGETVRLYSTWSSVKTVKTAK
ncbi:MAG: InlB B-repeat-containing protein [Acetobacter sp.]|nr:InlB B-repeat-containing protein [Bacteroides sp.]MCM1340306.1 InlB B-repeat-containing protein [Acetobacter sp.]MCM1433047.1 InlB B-repeat-containing protein [Clostridiales bacterium]